MNQSRTALIRSANKGIGKGNKRATADSEHYAAFTLSASEGIAGSLVEALRLNGRINSNTTDLKRFLLGYGHMVRPKMLPH